MNRTPQPLEQRFAFEVRWAPTRGWLLVRDCFTGEWLEVAKDDVPPRWKGWATARKKRWEAERDGRR